LPVAAEYRPGLMPQKSTFRPGAITSWSRLPAAAATSALLGRADDVAAGLLVRGQLDEPFLFRFLEEV
jgi:hypothetical protein